MAFPVPYDGTAGVNADPAESEAEMVIRREAPRIAAMAKASVSAELSRNGTLRKQVA